jgi:hypothetical protein
MFRPLRLFTLTLAAAILGPGSGCAPTARAGLVTDTLAAPPAFSQAAPFQTYYKQPPGFEQTAGVAEPSAFDLPVYPERSWGHLLRPDERGPIPGPGCDPLTSSSGAGSAGGSGSVAGGGFAAAGLPSEPVPPHNDVADYLALEEALQLPSAFHPSLFRPPRQDR